MLSRLSGTGSGSESIDVEAVANPTTSARTATITITDGGSLTEMVSVSQDDPSATLAVLPTSLTFCIWRRGRCLCPITSNTSWMASSDVNWLTLSTSSDTGNGMIDVVATANTTASERTATITITYGISSRLVSVFASCDAYDFICICDWRCYGCYWYGFFNCCRDGTGSKWWRLCCCYEHHDYSGYDYGYDN